MGDRNSYVTDALGKELVELVRPVFEQHTDVDTGKRAYLVAGRIYGSGPSDTQGRIASLIHDLREVAPHTFHFAVLSFDGCCANTYAVTPYTSEDRQNLRIEEANRLAKQAAEEAAFAEKVAALRLLPDRASDSLREFLYRS